MLGLAPAARAQTGTSEQLRARSLTLVNEARQAEGLPPLKLGREANAAAQAHAGDMRKRRYYSHVSPEGDTVKDRYLRAGGNRSQLAAENIARCPECTSSPGLNLVQQLHQGWMDSPGHRRNILMPGLTTFGFAIVTDRQFGMHVVQVFAGPGQPVALEPGEPEDALNPDQQRQRASVLVNQLRRHQAVAELTASPVLAAASQALLQRFRQDESRIAEDGSLRSALSPEQRRAWTSLGVLVGSCGGCGTVPADADIRFFLQQWLDDPGHEALLIDAAFTHLGFMIAADGEGRKVAVALLGRQR